MKIAFVGKGGSGKSTISTLFFLDLMRRQFPVAFFDADLNIHVPQLLGVEIDQNKSISLDSNARQIKDYLRGKSKHIESADHMYKTTPPSTGVNYFELQKDNPLIKDYMIPYESGYLGIVGTYENDAIGVSCYHTNLSVLENILSFARLKQSNDEIIITDMVAGIDAFSNTLHAQFDALFLVIEPTMESINVYKQYRELSETSGIFDRVFVVLNKIEDESDVEFVHEYIDPERIVATFSASKGLKRQRQQGKPFSQETLDLFAQSEFDNILEAARKNPLTPEMRLKKLHELHKKYVAQDYVVNAVGDLTSQIEEDFSF